VTARRRGETRRALAAALVLGTTLAGTPSAAPVAVPPEPRFPGRAALDLAFRFASAIAADAKDRARAQEEVARDYAARGAFAEAERAAERIEGWRRGTALADVAAGRAAAGQPEEARRLLARAEQERAEAPGWQGARIEAHIASALAVLGEVDRAETMAAALAARDRQYGGRAVAVTAAGLARRGDREEALQRLATLGGDTDIDVAWSRTEAYLDVARRSDDDAAVRRRALDGARLSADGLPGWKKAEALVLVSREERGAGRMAEAREALRRAEAIVRALPATMPVKGRLLADLGRAWHEAGRSGEAREALSEAEETIAAAPVIDRPGLYATLAAARGAAEGPAAAHKLYERAIASAETLRNARPRALAAVSICRVLGREDVALDGGIRSRLEAILNGLADPW
jgi:hypothetical protein